MATRSVNDLGVAAFLLMYGFEPAGKSGRRISFNIPNKASNEDFDRLVLEYQPPNEFYTFDSCLMFLKKIEVDPPETSSDDPRETRTLSDLGLAAYLLLHEYKADSIGVEVVGKRGKYVTVRYPVGAEAAVDRLSLRYLTSQCQTYDSCLMGLKKFGEHTV